MISEQEWISLGTHLEQWMTESLGLAYRIIFGIKFRGFEKGVGGRGLAINKPPKTQYLSRQSNLKTWLVHVKVREPHLNPPVRMNFLPLALVFKGKRQDNSYEPGGSDAVRELSREPAMFQIELQGEVLKNSQKGSPEMCPPLLSGHRRKGTQKRPQSLAYEGLPRANPLCLPTPFRNFW